MKHTSKFCRSVKLLPRAIRATKLREAVRGAIRGPWFILDERSQLQLYTPHRPFKKRRGRKWLGN